MSLIYRIEIHLYPNNVIDDSKPYFWCLQSCLENDWCTENAGWESSSELAWESAYCFYKKYHFKKSKE